jgi:hypothetical protein
MAGLVANLSFSSRLWVLSFGIDFRPETRHCSYASRLATIFKNNTMKDIFTKILIALITLGLGIPIGIWTESLRNEQANKMRFLDFDSQFHTNIIGHPDALEKKMNVFIDGIKVENISQIDIQIFNFTDKDFADVPLFIEINSLNGDTLKLLNEKVAGQEGLSDYIIPIQKIEPAKFKGALKFGYKLRTINRIGYKPVFTASFLIIGKADHFQINTMQSNLDIVKFDYEHFKKSKIWESSVFILICLLIFYLCFLFWIIRTSAKSQIKYNIKFGEFLKGKLVNTEEADSISIINQIIKLKNIYDWESTKKWRRIIEGQKNPEE